MTMPPDRRTFLRSVTAAFALRTGLPFDRFSQKREPIAFSTLGCPKWEWLRILDFAAAEGFTSLELRGLEAAMDLTVRAEFGAAQIERTRKQLKDRNLRVSGLGSSANMHEPPGSARDTQFAEARRFIDLAHALEAPYVRVFGNKWIEGEARDKTLARIVSSLRELGEYARGKNVTVLLESHGDFTDSPTLRQILDSVASPQVALLWDAHHTFAFSHEQPDYTFEQVGKYIRHTHLKDSVPDGKGGRRYVLTGQGEVPVKRQVEVLAAGGYRGAYCFEWEKRWHPEIEEPEVAFPHYARTVRQYLGEKA
jgi:sugar phosphate isomerase/epimerase